MGEQEVYCRKSVRLERGRRLWAVQQAFELRNLGLRVRHEIPLRSRVQLRHLVHHLLRARLLSATKLAYPT